jgi:hypothetical protein
VFESEFLLYFKNHGRASEGSSAYVQMPLPTIF